MKRELKTLVQHKNVHKGTEATPIGRITNQIDHIFRGKAPHTSN